MWICPIHGELTKPGCGRCVEELEAKLRLLRREQVAYWTKIRDDAERHRRKALERAHDNEPKWETPL